MISDTLFDAVARIKDYLRDLPECYADCRQEIRNVLCAMDALRLFLDSIPRPEMERVQSVLGQRIRELDLTLLRAAKVNLINRATELRERRRI